MKKTWTINNGWNRMNTRGQLVQCEIGPRDFDPDYEANMEYAACGGKLPYRAVGASYIFARKRDFDAAVKRLRANGFIS